jgi:hypothetical protein
MIQVFSAYMEILITRTATSSDICMISYTGLLKIKYVRASESSLLFSQRVVLYVILSTKFSVNDPSHNSWATATLYMSNYLST